jgi:CheY-like chemotaxis protein
MPKSGPIVIVEDDTDDQQLLEELFHELKVPNVLRFFSSAIAALDYLIATIERPFLIISDINLPAMSGLDFLKRINDQSKLKSKRIPFVFFSTASNPSVIQQAYDLSAQGYFIKPLTSHQLKQTMAAILTYWTLSSVAI